MTGVNNTQNELTTSETDARRTIVFWTFFSTFAITISFVAYLIFAEFNCHKLGNCLAMQMTMPSVVVAGVLGSFVSALHRILSAQDKLNVEEYAEKSKSGMLYNIVYASIPPLTGAITAAILYAVFAGEILSGSLFPAFSCANKIDNCTNFDSFLHDFRPKEAPDIAKAIVWGFIAGFSERFVPNVLNRITVDSNGKDP